MVKMEDMKRDPTHWWLFDSHHSSRRTPWLQSTLGELDQKIKAMLKLIDEDADSFAQRAEMYYKKRPELVGMVEDFYRAHRSLAERYDQLKSESGNRVLSTLGSPFSAKSQSEKLVSSIYQNYDTHSDCYDDIEDAAESEVDDPEDEDEIHVDGELIIGEVEQQAHKLADAGNSSLVLDEKLEILRDELERLRKENTMQKDQLLQKDEEKREVIRQLSLAVEALKSENLELRKCVARVSRRKRRPFEFETLNLKEAFFGKLFSGSTESQGTVIAL
ncbi:hypothetical protein K2173_004716 [Erythroxylum novogranatense]|uniref:NAB domain-containing protein n=1 Tax=Erythroxylum novogranatense TaxID=1862640 RepID=A0AAV8UBG4_9ROSI|nr:hypothetical protein K2173_004716 [Erythroxylum novogranatense]